MQHNLLHCYDRQVWEIDNEYRMKITNVFSPSRFWIVTRIQEHDLLHRFLQHFYSLYQDFYWLHKSQLCQNQHYVVMAFGSYYRAVLRNATPIHGNEDVRVFLVDYGISTTVRLKNVFHLLGELCNVPVFAIQATFSGVKPTESWTWSPDSTDAFRDMVQDKLLKGKLKHLDDVNKTIELELDEYYNQTGGRNLIRKALLDQKLANPLTDSNEKKDLDAQQPSFSSIEEGFGFDQELDDYLLLEITLSYLDIGEILITSISQFGS
ncbi:hypothetical protein GWI33_014582 [Rhynchophorus ferrugineus]|uniref:Tudor domain-containing protein n=1 Tax=Rhynchophorus ferrugineus TaxID=354439 RepID=A0A834I5T5_RHYFE|nr:hypothetical protein GWI33_014582 [Rhynchophorus ferrugineus]